MGVGTLLTEVSEAIISVLKIVLPGAVEAFVQMFDSLAFTQNGDATTMTAAFGWIVIASIVSLAVWGVRLLVGKAIGGRTRA